MIRKLALAAAIGLAALPGHAQSAAEKAAMVQAIAAAGCRVTAQNNASVLASAGLSEDAAAAVVQNLLNSGEAVIQSGDLVLKTGACS